MKINFTVDTDEIFSEEGETVTFEDIFRQELNKATLAQYHDKLASDSFIEYSRVIAEKLENELKNKLESFLSEEIALTDKWGKKEFVGSIEDLIKSRIDAQLLRPVDSNGKEITGCHTSGHTYLEWFIERKMKEYIDAQMEYAKKDIRSEVVKTVKARMNELTSGLICDTVSDALGKVLK